MYSTVNIGKITKGLARGWRVRFEASLNDTRKSDIAIDDISFVNCNPNDYLLSFKCDFETNFCGWYNEVVGSKFNWTRNKGQTTSDETGPPGDQ